MFLKYFVPFWLFATSSIVGPFMTFFPKKYRRILFETWIKAYLFLQDKQGYKYEINGFIMGKHENVLYISNHPSEADWLFIFYLLYLNGRLHFLKIVLKEPLKFTLFGMGCMANDYIFVSRNNPITDSLNIQLRVLKTIQEKEPISILIFPEGTDFTEEKLKKQKCSNYSKLLNPKSGGIHQIYEQFKTYSDMELYPYFITLEYNNEKPSFSQAVTGNWSKNISMSCECKRIDSVSKENTKNWLEYYWSKMDYRLNVDDAVYEFKPMKLKNDATISFFQWTLTCLMIILILFPFKMFWVVWTSAIIINYFKMLVVF